MFGFTLVAMSIIILVPLNDGHRLVKLKKELKESLR